MAALIVKMTDGTDIRRHTARADQLTYASLHKRVAEAFQLSATSFKIQYKDDEGDEITMSCEEELAEAIGLALKLEPAVLRLKIAKSGKRDEPAAPQDARTQTPSDERVPNVAPGAPEPFAQLLSNISQQLPALVQQLPPAVRCMIPNAELDIEATVKATAEAAAAAATGAAHAAHSFAQSAAGPNFAHSAAGPDFAHSAAGPDFAHAASAAAAAASNFTKAAFESAAKVAAAAEKSGVEGFHPGVTCDRSGMCPIVGNRYQLTGHDYDLCEEEFSKLRDDEKALYTWIPPPRHRRVHQHPAVHYGVSCDKSGVCPIVGVRYHLRGRNYDLCQAEYDKLTPQEQGMFQAIERPQGGGGCGMPHRNPNRGRCGGGFGGGFEGPFNKNPLAARFVHDVSIHDGTEMAPGTKFTKIWRLKNVGDVPWPQGTRLLRVGGDAIGALESVPISPDNAAVVPGAEVDIAVDMTAPSEMGRFIGYWRLTGPWGRRKFGQRVWAHIQVIDPAAPPQPPTEIEINTPPRGEATDDDDGQSAAAGEDPAAAVSAPAAAMAVDASAMAVDASAMAVDAAGPPASAAPPAADDAEMVAAGADVVTGDAGASAPTSAEVEVGAAAAAAAAAAGEGTERVSAEAQGVASAAAGASPADEEKAKAIDALTSMGFVDAALVAAVVDKNGPDIESCANELVSLSEWDAMLSDLEEMGFADRERNQQLLVENSGSLKKTVKTLVADAA